MKLAEALILRADLMKKTQELRARIIRNALFQEGDTPAENPEHLISESERTLEKLETLIVSINKTNMQSHISSGELIVEALAKRDILKLKHELFKTLANEATPNQRRLAQSQIKYISAIDVKALQKKADGIAKEHRELDSEIQCANWTVDLFD